MTDPRTHLQETCICPKISLPHIAAFVGRTGLSHALARCILGTRRAHGTSGPAALVRPRGFYRRAGSGQTGDGTRSASPRFPLRSSL